jgi:hypothetical protein
MTERIIYKGLSSEGFTFQKYLELRSMILDPTFKPYMVRKDNNNNNYYDGRDRLIARSASSSHSINTENEKKSIVQKQLELREMILGY